MMIRDSGLLFWATTYVEYNYYTDTLTDTRTVCALNAAFAPIAFSGAVVTDRTSARLITHSHGSARVF